MPIPSQGLALTLSSALCWALFDVLRKRLAREVAPLYLGLLLSLAQAPLLALWAAGHERFGLPVASLGVLVGSALLNVIAVVLFLESLRLSHLSLIIPLLSFTPVLSTTLAWIFRGQVPAPVQYTGAVLVILGAMLLGMSGGAWKDFKTFLKEPGVRRMAVVTLLWSCTSVLDQAAVARGAGAWYAPILTGVVASVLLLWVLLRGQGQALRLAATTLPGRPLLAGVALVGGATALALQIESYRWAPIGFIEVIKRGIGMGSAVVLGHLVFQEPLMARKWVAVALMTLGVALVVGLR